ncbi:hypothetical protein [Limnohabitans sp.]|uniref:hypothetical protein n=1 Tax=Limnohabitans sp. TaxID=1907725 RepID=UPI0025C28219|nr:hypothetical protein [Limnohabitans sp.]
MKISNTLSFHYFRHLAIALTFLPSIALADRYGICEGPNCGGGAINGIFAMLLILVFLSFLGLKRAGIYLFVWLAPVLLAISLNEKGYAAAWGIIGFYLSIFITAWIIEFFGLDEKEKNDQEPKD